MSPFEKIDNDGYVRCYCGEWAVDLHRACIELRGDGPPVPVEEDNR